MEIRIVDTTDKGVCVHEELVVLFDHFETEVVDVETLLVVMRSVEETGVQTSHRTKDMIDMAHCRIDAFILDHLFDRLEGNRWNWDASRFQADRLEGNRFRDEGRRRD